MVLPSKAAPPRRSVAVPKTPEVFCSVLALAKSSCARAYRYPSGMLVVPWRNISIGVRRPALTSSANPPVYASTRRRVYPSWEGATPAAISRLRSSIAACIYLSGAGPTATGAPPTGATGCQDGADAGAGSEIAAYGSLASVSVEISAYGSRGGMVNTHLIVLGRPSIVMNLVPDGAIAACSGVSTGSFSGVDCTGSGETTGVPASVFGL